MRLSRMSSRWPGAPWRGRTACIAALSLFPWRLVRPRAGPEDLQYDSASVASCFQIVRKSLGSTETESGQRDVEWRLIARDPPDGSAGV